DRDERASQLREPESADGLTLRHLPRPQTHARARGHRRAVRAQLRGGADRAAAPATLVAPTRARARHSAGRDPPAPLRPGARSAFKKRASSITTTHRGLYAMSLAL